MKTTIQLKCAMVVVLTCSSCNSLFEDPLIKNNPNAVTDVPIETLLSGTLVGVAKIVEDTDTRIAFMWSGQLTGINRQHLPLSHYQVSAGSFDWGDYYTVASQARLIQDKADILHDKWQKGIGQVVEALILTKVASLWGDVPYSQAFDAIKYPTPVFDKQLDVYAALLTTLGSAIQNLSAPTGINPGAKDFIYNGDVKKWIRAAYSLKARLYLHLGDYANAISSAKLGISSPSNDALIPHGNSLNVDLDPNNGFFAYFWVGDTSFDPPTFLPTFMQAHANPKTNETALYNHYFQFALINNGLLDPNVNDGAFFGQTSSFPVLTYFENQFIIAEASARLSLLQDGVDALNAVRQVLKTGSLYGSTIDPAYQALGIQYDDYVLADFNPGGIANSLVSGRNQQSGLLYEIISQKYIVMLAQYEVFNDIRRLAKAIPVVQLGIQPIVATPTGGLPQRFIYPQNEINTNPNVPKEGNGGVADQYQKLPIFQ